MNCGSPNLVVAGIEMLEIKCACGRLVGYHDEDADFHVLIDQMPAKWHETPSGAIMSCKHCKVYFFVSGFDYFDAPRHRCGKYAVVLENDACGRCFEPFVRRHVAVCTACNFVQDVDAMEGLDDESIEARALEELRRKHPEGRWRAAFDILHLDAKNRSKALRDCKGKDVPWSVVARATAADYKGDQHE